MTERVYFVERQSGSAAAVRKMRVTVSAPTSLESFVEELVSKAKPINAQPIDLVAYWEPAIEDWLEVHSLCDVPVSNSKLRLTSPSGTSDCAFPSAELMGTTNQSYAGTWGGEQHERGAHLPSMKRSQELHGSMYAGVPDGQKQKLPPIMGASAMAQETSPYHLVCNAFLQATFQCLLPAHNDAFKFPAWSQHGGDVALVSYDWLKNLVETLPLARLCLLHLCDLPKSYEEVLCRFPDAQPFHQEIFRLSEALCCLVPDPHLSLVVGLTGSITELSRTVGSMVDRCKFFVRPLVPGECLVMFQQKADYMAFANCWRERQSCPGLTRTVQSVVPFALPTKMLLRCPVSDGRKLDSQKFIDNAYSLKLIVVEKVLEEQDSYICICEPEASMINKPMCNLMGIDFEVYWKDYAIACNLPASVELAALSDAFSNVGELKGLYPCLDEWKLVAICSKTPFERSKVIKVGAVEAVVFGGSKCTKDADKGLVGLFFAAYGAAMEEVVQMKCQSFRANMVGLSNICSAEAAAQNAAKQVCALFDSTEASMPTPLPLNTIEARFRDEISFVDQQAAKVLEEAFDKFVSGCFTSSLFPHGCSGAGNDPKALCDLHLAHYRKAADSASHLELHLAMKNVTPSPSLVFLVQEAESKYLEQMQTYPAFMRHRIGLVMTEFVERIRVCTIEALRKSESALKDEVFRLRWKATAMEQLHSVGYDHRCLAQCHFEGIQDCASLRGRLESDGCDPATVSRCCEELLRQIEQCYQQSVDLSSKLTKLLWIPAEAATTADEIRLIWKNHIGADVDVVSHPRRPNQFVVVPFDLVNTALDFPSSAIEPINELLVKLKNAQAACPGQRWFQDCHVITPLPVVVEHKNLPSPLVYQKDCSNLIFSAFTAADASVQSCINTDLRMTFFVEDAHALLALPKQLVVSREPIYVDKGKIYMISFPEDSKWTTTQIRIELRAQGYCNDSVLEVCPWFANEVLILMSGNASLPQYVQLCGTQALCLQQNPGATGLMVAGGMTSGASNPYVSRKPRIWDTKYYSQLSEKHDNIENFIDDFQRDEFHMLWDPKAWLKEVHRSADRIPMERLNVCVTLNTLGICKSGEYIAMKCGTQCHIDNSVMTVTKHCVQQYEPRNPRFQASGTHVSVLPMDTIDAGMTMLAKGVDPARMVLLDFANAHHAGGGYSHGTIAQEEDLFRRSNLSFALDIERFGITGGLYPFGEYESLIVRQASVFRESSHEGHSLIPPKLFNFLVAAAYNAGGRVKEPFPVLDGKKFSKEGFVRTLRKIYDTIFLAALEQNFEVLVLGAIGCGAFGNPADEVAHIFLELIRCVFAGYFQEIVFAIPDAKGMNFNVFKGILAPGGQTVYRCMDGLSRAHPFNFASAPKICHWLADCHDQDDPAHAASFLHPPACPYGDLCQLDADRFHCKMFRHIKSCPNGKACMLYFSEDANVRTTHRKQFKHLDAEMRAPLCPDGIHCRKQASDPQHQQLFRHEAKPCDFKGNCPHFGASRHFDSFLHPFNQPCKHTPCCHSMNDPQHLSQFSHLCKHGAHCTEKAPDHGKNFIHIIHHDCVLANCAHVGSDIHPEVHLSTYSHVGIPDIRPECKHGVLCREIDDLEHIKAFAHPPKAIPPSRFLGHNVYAKLFISQQQYRFTLFIDNRRKLQQRLQDWLKANGKPAPNETTLKEVQQWMRNFRVVHRCNPATFEKMWRTGNLLSLHCIQTNAKDSHRCAELATQHQIVHQMIAAHPEAARLLQDLVKKITRSEFLSDEAPVANSGSLKGGTEAAMIDLQSSIQSNSSFLESIMPLKEIDLVKRMISSCASSMRSLANESVGIGYDVDEKYGTNLTVFGIFGPHKANYGKDPHSGMHLVLRPEIMFYPDFWLTPCAVTSYNSHQRDKERPWSWICPGSGLADAREAVFREKLHPIDPGFFEYLALEYTVRTSTHAGKDLSKVVCDDVKKWWLAIESHGVSESHMHYAVPFSYVERIVMHDVNHKKLPKDIQDQLNNVLGANNVHVISDPDVTAVERESTKLATQPQPYPRPPAYVFTAVHEYPVIVPIISGDGGNDDGYWVYIRACGLPYSVMFRGAHENDVLTVTFEKDRSYITKTIAQITPTRFLAESMDMNHHCHPVQGYFHLIRLKCKENTIVVKHFGPSLIYCRAKMKVSGKGHLPDKIASMVLWIPNQPVQFDMVRIANCKQDKIKSPLNEPRLPKKDKGPGRLTNEQNNSRNPVAAFVGKQIDNVCELMDAFKNIIFGQTTLPKCKLGLLCNIAYDPSNKDHDAHTKQFCHVCLYGQTCREKDDAAHQKQFAHVDKPICSLRQCPQLDDVLHRARFHHKGRWDFLMPCRDGSKCPKKSLDDHRTKYTHIEGVAYTLTEKGSILVDASGGALSQSVGNGTT